MEDVLVPPSFYVNTHLHVSHVTANDVTDHEIATRISLESPSCPLSGVGVPNDATNTCVFLALQICDAILGATGNKNSLGTCLDNIPQIATEMIISYPLELNKIRDLSSLYTVLDANKLIRDHNHLKNEFEFTEELPYADGVLAEVSNDRIQQKMQELANGQTFSSIYNFEPFSFLIGSLSR